MKIYISGPITGRPKEEAERHFNEVAEFLKREGHTVINPVDIAPWNLSWATFMKISFEIIQSQDIDAVMMLKGWKDSHGACLERYFAKLNKLPIWYQYGRRDWKEEYDEKVVWRSARDDRCRACAAPDCNTGMRI